MIPGSVIKEIDAVCDNRDASHAILEKRSHVYKAFVDLNNAFIAKRDTAGISRKNKVLMLIGMHVIHGSKQSVEFSVSAAIQVGATDPEIFDALDIALLVGGGAALALVQFATNVLTHRRAAGDRRDRFQFVSESTTPDN